MIQIIIELLSLTLTLTVAALLLMSKNYLTSLISNKFNESIEDYKKNITEVIEDYKYNLSRHLSDFNKYSQKRHEAYSELFRLVLIAEGQIKGLVGLRHEPTFEEYTKEELKNYLLKRGFIESICDKILSQHDTNREFCIGEVKKYLRIAEYQEAENKYIEAKNYFLISELYLSDDIILCTDVYLDILHKLLIEYDPSMKYYETGKEYRERIKNFEKQSLENKDLLKTKLKSELSFSDFKKKGC